LFKDSILEETKLENKNGKIAWKKDTKANTKRTHPNLNAKFK
jgi:hypothetical protein